MRRVYYSFALSIVEHPMFWHGAFLGGAALLLAHWLHVSSIIHNFMATPIGSAPSFVANSFLNAATHGELLMVSVVVLSTLVGASVLWRLAHTLALSVVSKPHAG